MAKVSFNPQTYLAQSSFELYVEVVTCYNVDLEVYLIVLEKDLEMMTLALDVRGETMLNLRSIGNSQGVVIPKSVLEHYDFSHGICAFELGAGILLAPAPVETEADPFGFGAAADEIMMLNLSDSDIPDILDDDLAHL